MDKDLENMLNYYCNGASDAINWLVKDFLKVEIDDFEVKNAVNLFFKEKFDGIADISFPEDGEVDE